MSLLHANIYFHSASNGIHLVIHLYKDVFFACQPSLHAPTAATGGVSLSDLEATRSTATTNLLELAALGANIWCRSGVGNTRGLAKVTLSLASLHRTAEQHGALAEGTAHGQGVECQALTSGFHDSGTGSLSEAQSTHLQLRDFIDTLVIGDLANDNSNLAILALHILDELRQGKWRPVSG